MLSIYINHCPLYEDLWETIIFYTLLKGKALNFHLGYPGTLLTEHVHIFALATSKFRAESTT